MNIAILGWGSLICDPRDLPLKGTWQQGGLILPIEFSRISCDCRLTLVIDPKHGACVRTRFVRSARDDLDDAMCDLRTREGSVTRRIGYVDLAQGAQHSRYHHIADTIKTWAEGHRFDAVVWTDLPSNFEEQTGSPFSLDTALEYLNRLPRSAAERAREYVRKAPREVDTPLRRMLHDTGWLRDSSELSVQVSDETGCS